MSMEIQQGKMAKLVTFLQECKRVIKVTRKPSTEEFKTIVKICALGMALIGLVGFLIQMVWRAL